jgi:ATP-dependent Clp protease ATP-binding subunit ClpA
VFERFTDRARTVVLLAQQAAAEVGSESIGREHLLVALHREGTGVAAVVLREAGAAEPSLGEPPAMDDAEALATIGIDLAEVRQRVGEQLGADAAERIIPFDDGAKAVLTRALSEAYELGHDYVGTEHLLLALDEDGTYRARVLELAAPDHLRVRDAERTVLRLFQERRDDPAVQPVLAAVGAAKQRAAVARAAVTRTLADDLEAALQGL